MAFDSASCSRANRSATSSGDTESSPMMLSIRSAVDRSTETYARRLPNGSSCTARAYSGPQGRSHLHAPRGRRAGGRIACSPVRSASRPGAMPQRADLAGDATMSCDVRALHRDRAPGDRRGPGGGPAPAAPYLGREHLLLGLLRSKDARKRRTVVPTRWCGCELSRHKASRECGASSFTKPRCQPPGVLGSGILSWHVQQGVALARREWRKLR